MKILNDIATLIELIKIELKSLSLIQIPLKRNGM
jgi:hypothetical protein